MGERLSKIGRVVGGASILLGTAFGTAGPDNPLNIPRAGAAASDAGKPQGNETIQPLSSLSTHMSPDIIARFELQKLADVLVQTHTLKTADGKPTFVHVHDSSININPLAIQEAIDTFTGEYAKNLIDSLKTGKNRGIDFVENSPMPGTTTFKYDYSTTPGHQPIGVVPYSISDITKERHFIITAGSNDKLPQWSTIGAGVTIRRRIDNSGIKDSTVQTTVLRTGELLKRPGDPNDNLNHAMLVEICQQTIDALAVKSGAVVTNLNDMSSRIAKEGVCNIFGTATNEKRKGGDWEKVKKINEGVVYDLGGVPSLKQFPVTEAFFNQLPQVKQLLTKK